VGIIAPFPTPLGPYLSFKGQELAVMSAWCDDAFFYELVANCPLREHVGVGWIGG